MNCLGTQGAAGPLLTRAVLELICLTEALEDKKAQLEENKQHN